MLSAQLAPPVSGMERSVDCNKRDGSSPAEMECPVEPPPPPADTKSKVRASQRKAPSKSRLPVSRKMLSAPFSNRRGIRGTPPRPATPHAGVPHSIKRWPRINQPDWPIPNTASGRPSSNLQTSGGRGRRRSSGVSRPDPSRGPRNQTGSSGSAASIFFGASPAIDAVAAADTSGSIRKEWVSESCLPAGLSLEEADSDAMLDWYTQDDPVELAECDWYSRTSPCHVSKGLRKRSHSP